MNKYFIHYLAFLITVLVIENLLFDIVEADWLRTTIALVTIGVILLTYGITTYIGRAPRGPNYPSTVRSRISQGLKRGATKP